ncbi:MAG: hypothetical protein GXP54_08465 [Deltaproteobacteria bacterium]|nr:hypothetical protein [Deltaproteobacteria bacterium]
MADSPAFQHRFDPAADLDIVRGSSLDLMVGRKGAEVIGLTLKRPDGKDVGLIWRNGVINPPDDGFWPRHAPVLFPVVGGLHGNRSMTTQGSAVRFPGLHGLARHSRFELVGAPGRDGSLIYRLDSNDETRAMFPWDFTLTITYTLGPMELKQSVTVLNRDSRPMPFQLGWHPGFPTPFVSGAKKECHLRLPQGRIRRMLNDADCRLTGESVELENTGDFQFTELELDRTYMFDLTEVDSESRVVELMDPDESVGVRVKFPDHPHLGLWSNAGAPFICIEPWQGMDDSVEQEPFDRKFGMVILDPGQSDVRTARIEAVSHQKK